MAVATHFKNITIAKPPEAQGEYYMKVNKIICLCFAVIMFLCTGCSASSVKTDVGSYDFSDIEEANYISDYYLLYEQYNTYSVGMEAISDESMSSFKKKAAILYSVFLENTYYIAKNRVDKDVDDISVYSDNYADHIAFLQAYAQTYLKDASKIKNYLKTGDFDSMLKLDSHNAFQQMQKNILAIIVLPSMKAYIKKHETSK